MKGLTVRECNVVLGDGGRVRTWCPQKGANNVANGNGRARWVAAGRDWDGLITDGPPVLPILDHFDGLSTWKPHVLVAAAVTFIWPHAPLYLRAARYICILWSLLVGKKRPREREGLSKFTLDLKVKAY